MSQLKRKAPSEIYHYAPFIIFDKDSTETAVESVETLVEETEEEVVGTTEETTTQDAEVKATKRGTRKSTVTK